MLTLFAEHSKSLWHDGSAFLTLGFLFTIVLFVIIGTICDYLTNDLNSQTELIMWKNEASTDLTLSQRFSTGNSFTFQALMSFSLKSNLRKILDTSSTANSVSIFHGVRVLCMVWIVCGHSYSFAIQWMLFSKEACLLFSPKLLCLTENPQKITKGPQNILSQILINGTFSVDCFFFISGFLVCYLALKELERSNGKFNFLSFYIHRYIRMTPLMMAIIAFCATVLPYLGDGPFWSDAIIMYNSWCKKNWWLNSIYLHNFLNRENMCLSHSWYSAVDMQLYIISPLIFIPLYKKARLGIFIIVALLVASMAVTGVLTGLRHYPAVPYFNDLISEQLINEYYGEIYIKPYCRIGPYLIGMALGYYIYISNGDIKMKKIHSIIGWSVAIVINIIILFVMLPANNGDIPNNYIAALYSALSRPAWAVGLAWITFVSLSGFGGIVHNFLSSKIFIPLSRLTYGAYLIHPIVMATFYGSREHAYDFSHYLMLYFIIGHLVITYLISLILTLLFESPIMGLEKLIRNKTRKS